MKCEEFVHGMVAGRVMALDVGKVRVGVALSDPLGYTGAASADAVAQESR
jgi:RNase H-fold protein (predicted Holliday junction resolvase)